jgi:hypothetical protein
MVGREVDDATTTGLNHVKIQCDAARIGARGTWNCMIYVHGPVAWRLIVVHSCFGQKYEAVPIVDFSPGDLLRAVN